jgi:hypothetical protein
MRISSHCTGIMTTLANTIAASLAPMRNEAKGEWGVGLAGSMLMR